MKTILKTNILKTILLTGLAFLAFLPPARADLIPVGTAHYKDVLVTDASGNNVLGLTTASFTATASVNGGARTTITTPTITESGQGHYWVLEPASLTGTLGVLSITLTTASGTVQTDSKDEIVPALPGIVTTNNDKAGYALATPPTFPTDYARNNVTPTWYTLTGDSFALISPLILSGKFTASALSNAPAGPSGTSLTDTQIINDVASALTAQGFSPTSVTKMLRQIVRIDAAEWGAVTKPGSAYSVAVPLAPTADLAPGAVAGTQSPTYVGGVLQSNPKTVN